MGRLETLAEFGYERDPFRSSRMDTVDAARVRRVIGMALESRAMVSLVAERGTGKTQALDMALRDKDVTVVRVLSADKEWVGIGDIERALIFDLSQESARRTREIRARQLRRILGEASRKTSVVLVLEESHRLHGSTLRALKSLREMEWMGQSPLFTVVMIGQYDPLQRAAVDEVRLRTDTVAMKGLTQQEIADYIEATVGKAFEPDAIQALSKCGQARNFLDLQEMAVQVMGRALEVGRKKVTPFEILAIYGGGLKEIRIRTGMTAKAVAEKLGVSTATISLIENGKGEKTDFGKDTYQAFAEVLQKETNGAPKTALKAVGEKG